MLTYILVGFALAADAFAVSVSAAACTDILPLMIGLRAALTFGFFQFLMPIVGWLLGSAFSHLIEGFDHWIAFGLLAFVGGKMLFEAIRTMVRARRASECPDPDSEPRVHGIMKWNTLLVLAFATSIDAMAVGLSYNILGNPILVPAVIIGITTFAICLIGLEFGRRLKEILEEWAEIAGGTVLILIGFKILLEHMLNGK
ncbi:MAG: manganese efflux pump MntP family protein [Rectinema sp.]|nr:manganese efflux pump MntP family protein [Rectinema sp.]